jgi:hypothetical protein
MNKLQKGTGENYTESDYETLLSRQLQVMINNHPKAAKKFKDTPIIVGEKVLRDALNNKISEGFATSSAMVQFGPVLGPNFLNLGPDNCSGVAPWSNCGLDPPTPNSLKWSGSCSEPACFTKGE